MNIQENISLKPYNTFGLDAKARFFVEITDLVTLQKTFELTAYPEYFILGGGSNILLTKDIEALVLHINLKGISVVEENETSVIVKAMAGENWHEFVLWALENDYGGLENLSLIPGNVGTAPMQNIGAYGVEIENVFVSCTAMKIASRELVEFDRDACQFGYRESIFKNDAKGSYIITSVQFELTKKSHRLNTSYGAIAQELERNHIDQPTIKDVSNAVIAIRESKLPNPKELGNSGSFFKNPVVDGKMFKQLLGNNPNMPYYKVDENTYKLPAGWLIEQCGFKGKRYGDAGVHDRQALVLVNHGNATGQELLNLAEHIQKAVEQRFGIALKAEVNIIK